MPELTEIIKLLRTGKKEELGKAWKERYKQVYCKPYPEFESFIRSKESAYPDLDDPSMVFNGELTISGNSI